MSQVQSKEPETPRRLFTLKCVNSDQVIHMGPCIVGNIVVSSDDGVGGASVYDGLNNLAERKYSSVVQRTIAPQWEQRKTTTSNMVFTSTYSPVVPTL